LREGDDVISELRGVSSWEVFAQKCIGETIACGERIGIRVQEPRLGLSFNKKGNSVKWMVSLKTPFILILLHFSNKEAMWLLGVLHWIASKLALLE